MAEFSFSYIADMYQKIFGAPTSAFDPKFDAVQLEPSQYATTAGAAYYGRDALTAAEYYMPVRITYPNLPPDADDTQTPNGSSDYYLPFPFISAARIAKRIIKTDLTERRGSFKEFINDGDWEFTIRGIIVGADRGFTETAIQQLEQLRRTRSAVSISNPLTDILLIHPDRKGGDQVVIEDLELMQTRGVQNVMGYEMRLTSDAPFNLYVTNGSTGQ